MRNNIDTSANPANLGCGFIIMAAITAVCFWLGKVTGGALSVLCIIAAWFMLIVTGFGLFIGILSFMYANYLIEDEGA